MITFPDLGRFYRDLQGEADRIMTVFGTVIRGAVLDLAELVVADTPTLTGLAKGSWRVGLNGEPPREGPIADGTGATSIRLIQGQLQKWIPGQEITLGNVAKNSAGDVYIYYVEFGTVHVRPRGFVRRAVVQFPALVEANIAKLERR